MKTNDLKELSPLEKVTLPTAAMPGRSQWSEAMALRCRGVRAVRGRAIGAGERLEDRHLLATFVVTNLLDAGTGSLREAVTQANEAAGADAIRFVTVSVFTAADGESMTPSTVTHCERT